MHLEKDAASVPNGKTLNKRRTNDIGRIARMKGCSQHMLPTETDEKTNIYFSSLTIQNPLFATTTMQNPRSPGIKTMPTTPFYNKRARTRNQTFQQFYLTPKTLQQLPQSNQQGKITFIRPTSIEDLDSTKVSIARVPSMASQTLKGQKLLRPIVQPIYYERTTLNTKTAQEFKVSKRDVKSPHKYDHIKQNIQMASHAKIQQYVQQKFKRSILNKNNNLNLFQIKKELTQKELATRNLSIIKCQRWINFKKRRAQVIDDYIKQKRKSKAMELLMKQMALRNAIMSIKSGLDTAKQLSVMRMSNQFIVALISIKWRNKLKKRQGIINIHKNRARHSISLMNTFIREKSILTIKLFLLVICGNSDAYQKFKTFQYNMNLMQKRVKDKLQTKYSKVEVLENYWDKMVGQIGFRASELDDRIGKQMVRNIILVPREVKNAALKEYVKKCVELYSIAFFQWRSQFPNQLRHNKGEIEEILESRFNHFYKSSYQREMEVSSKTRNCSKLPKNFDVKYNMMPIGQKPFMVDSFEAIGFADPFPEEQIITHGNVKAPFNDQKVYGESRYIKENSPSVIYIPTRQVMIKMMRACVAVNHPGELWFNKTI